MRVMFMQSQAFFGSDSGIHALMMRHFDRSVVQPYVALTVDDVDPPNPSANAALRTIPRMRIRPTYFGPSIHLSSVGHRMSALTSGPRVADSLLSLATYIRRERIQVLHGTEKPRDAFYGVLLGKLTGAKSIVHMHVGFDDWLTPRARWAIRNADGLVGVSRFIARNMLRGGLLPERVYHVLNALDLSGSKWDPTIDGRAARASLGIAPEAPVIGIASRLYLWKGHTDLVHAMRRIVQAVPEARLVIVGEDDPRAHPGGGSYRAELEALVRELGLEHQVIFTGFRTDVPQLMAAFDVFAMPTWEEPCAVVFLEAMSMEKPVVAWDSGGTPEMVAHGETGFVVERKSEDALVEALLTLIRDPDLRRRMGQAGRRRVEAHFNPARMCRDMVEVYRAVLGEAPATANVQSHLHGGSAATQRRGPRRVARPPSEAGGL